jgi:hypothetical protein
VIPRRERRSRLEPTVRCGMEASPGAGIACAGQPARLDKHSQRIAAPVLGCARGLVDAQFGRPVGCHIGFEVFTQEGVHSRS